MSKHLSNQDINGYIHHTLNDADRETMDRHLDECPVCRERVSVYERQQHSIFQDISAELRQIRTPDSMSFTAIRPGLNRSRKLAVARDYSSKVLTGVGAVTVAALAAFAFAFVFQLFNATPAASAPEHRVMASTLFPNAWDGQNPYRSVLVSSEQTALDQIRSAPVYHLDLQFDEELFEIEGQQEVRYVNNTGRSLGALYFRLLPRMDAESIEINQVQVNGRSVNPIMETPSTLRIPLPSLLLPHEQTVVQMDFTTKLNTAERNSLMLAHFHPTLAVFGKDEWLIERPVHDIDALPENSFYLVTVTAPRDLEVMTSGVHTKQAVAWEDESFQMQRHYAAGPINQLFLAVGSDLHEVKDVTEAGTQLIGYATNETQRPLVKTILAHTQAALSTYNQLFGSYPFSELKIVISSSPELAQTQLPGVLVFSDELAAYEETDVAYEVAYSLAAQWFGRIVGYNILAEPWLAQAPSYYAAHYYLVEAGLMTEQDFDAYWANKEDGMHFQKPLIGQNAYKFTPTEYQQTMAGAGPLFMMDLSYVMGDGMMKRFLQTYYQTFKWQLPTAVSFQQTAEESCGCSLSSLFETRILGKQLKPDKSVSYD